MKSEADRLRVQRDDILRRQAEAEDKRLAEAEARGYARGVEDAIDVLRGYRGAVQAESAVSDVKRLLVPKGERR